MQAIVNQIWEQLGEIPVDSSDNITIKFRHFPIGTSKFDIWAWIEEKFDYPVASLMYPNN